MLEQLKANSEQNSVKIKRAERNLDRVSEKEDVFEKIIQGVQKMVGVAVDIYTFGGLKAIGKVISPGEDNSQT
jgi:hypothetical protein